MLIEKSKTFRNLFYNYLKFKSTTNNTKLIDIINNNRITLNTR